MSIIQSVTFKLFKNSANGSCEVTSCSLTDLSVASGEPSQSHPRHVKQPDLPIVMRESNDLLVHRHADPGAHQHWDNSLKPKHVGQKQQIITF